VKNGLYKNRLAVAPASTHMPSEKDRLMREVESMDRGIDGLVYELYGLTEDEIKIVEKK